MAIIKLGIMGPMYGTLSTYGYNLRVGANLAVKHINARGGILGRKLAAKAYDDTVLPGEAETAVGQGNQYVVGHPVSGKARMASDVYDANRVIFISPAATTPEVARGSDYFFRTVGTDAAQAATACDWIVKNVGSSATVAVLHDGLLHGSGLAKSVKQGLEGKEVKVAMAECIRERELRPCSIVERLQQNGIDFAYFAGDVSSLTWILEQARAAGSKATFMTSDDATMLGEHLSGTGLSFIGEDSSGPEFLEGLLMTSPVRFRDVPNASNMALALEMEQLDKESYEKVKSFMEKRPCISPLAYLTYAAVEVLAQATEAAGCEDVDKGGQALRSGTFQTPIGSISFDAYGDLKPSEKASEFVVERCHVRGPKTKA